MLPARYDDDNDYVHEWVLKSLQSNQEMAFLFIYLFILGIKKT